MRSTLAKPIDFKINDELFARWDSEVDAYYHVIITDIGGNTCTIYFLEFEEYQTTNKDELRHSEFDLENEVYARLKYGEEKEEEDNVYYPATIIGIDAGVLKLDSKQFNITEIVRRGEVRSHPTDLEDGTHFGQWTENETKATPEMANEDDEGEEGDEGDKQETYDQLGDNIRQRLKKGVTIPDMAKDFEVEEELVKRFVDQFVDLE